MSKESEDTPVENTVTDFQICVITAPEESKSNSSSIVSSFIDMSMGKSNHSSYDQGDSGGGPMMARARTEV